MSVTQNTLQAIFKAPMTAGEIASAIGKSEADAKKTLSALVSTKHVVRQTGIDQTVEYRITPDGIARCVRNKLAAASSAPTPDSEKPMVAEQTEEFVEPPAPADDAPVTIADEAPEPQVAEPVAEDARGTEIGSEPDESLYFVEHPEDGFVPIDHEGDAATLECEICASTGKSVPIYLATRIGAAVIAAHFVRGL